MKIQNVVRGAFNKFQATGISLRRQRLPAGKLLPLFNIMSLGKLTQSSKRFTSRHDARDTEISVSDAEKFRTHAAELLDFHLI